MPLTPEAALDRLLSDFDRRPGDRPIGLAVSGGGDSMALLHVAAARAARDGMAFMAATVDHGLRPGSAGEAGVVAATCTDLGIPHETLRWVGWDGRGNLQAEARDARRKLLADWAGRHGLRDVLLGHTADDQAETVLMRLARGSGVDGLAGMKGCIFVGDAMFSRPFIGIEREALREWLRTRAIPWIDDPSNDDPRFDRVKARAMMGHLAALGLTRERLLRTAGHMQNAQTVLDLHAAEKARDVSRSEDGDLLLPRRLLEQVRFGDTSGRIVAAALMWVGGRNHRPRYEALQRLAATVGSGRKATLSGCLVSLDGEFVRIAPEPGRARPRAGAWDFAMAVGAGEWEG